MVQEAATNNLPGIENNQAQFIKTKADQIPFDNGFFNKVFSVNTIYFWENPNLELTEIHRVLKKGALFILTVRSLESMKSIPITQYDFTLYNQEQLTELLSNKGFKLTEFINLPEPPRELFNGEKIKLDSWIFSTEVS